MEESQLDITCSEIDAYRELYGWIQYGDYVNKVKPQLVKDGRIKEVTELAEKMRKEQRKKKRGMKNVKSDKLHKYR